MDPKRFDHTLWTYDIKQIIPAPHDCAAYFGEIDKNGKPVAGIGVSAPFPVACLALIKSSEEDNAMCNANQESVMPMVCFGGDIVPAILIDKYIGFYSRNNPPGQ